MVDIKPHVENLLKTIKNVKVAFYYPSDFNVLPVISYYEIANTEGMRADNVEWSQDTDIQIDIWGKTPKQVNDIGITVNDVMQKDGWGRTFSADLPKDGEIYHRTMRFNKQIYL